MNYWYQSGNYGRVLNKPTDTDPIRVVESSFYNHFLQVQAGLSFDIEKIFNGTIFKPAN
jgi:hypothetical protein